MNYNPNTDTPTGLVQTPATPSPGSPLDSATFDRLFEKVISYRERSAFRADCYINLENMSLTSIVYGVLPDDLKELYLGGNPITEIDCSLLPPTLGLLDVSHCRHLTRILNLDQLPNLTELLAEDTAIQSLPRLPTTLRGLVVSHCPYLTALPTLTRTGLRRLIMDWTHMDTIPQLPETLHTFSARFSNIGVELPMIPDSLRSLDMHGSLAINEGFLLERPDTVSVQEYTETTRKWWNACLRKERFDLLHESLMAAAWHPSRVSKWSLAGEEVLDMMMGC